MIVVDTMGDWHDSAVEFYEAADGTDFAALWKKYQDEVQFVGRSWPTFGNWLVDTSVLKPLDSADTRVVVIGDIGEFG